MTTERQELTEEIRASAEATRILREIDDATSVPRISRTREKRAASWSALLALANARLTALQGLDQKPVKTRKPKAAPQPELITASETSA